METKELKIIFQFAIVTLMTFSCIMNPRSNTEDAFISDNCYLPYNHWIGWHVLYREGTGYYLVRKEVGDSLRQFIFWRERTRGNTIYVRFCDNERTMILTLDRLHDSPEWSMFIENVNYHDLYDLIQLCFNYEIIELSIRDSMLIRTDCFEIRQNTIDHLISREEIDREINN